MRTIKCVIVGDGAVGKTSMIMTYAGREFNENRYIPTVFDNYTGTVTVDDKPVCLNIFDTAGQDNYDQLRILTYPGCDIVLICFSLNDRISFYNVKDKWIEEANHYAPEAPKLVIGTKSDARVKCCRCKGKLCTCERMNAVTYEQGRQMSKEIKAIDYLECSAKNDQGIKEVFNQAISHVIRKSLKPKKHTKCTLI